MCVDTCSGEYQSCNPTAVSTRFYYAKETAMKDIVSDVLTGKIELDIEFADQNRSVQNKWAWLRNLIANDIRPVEAESSKGWAKIPLINKAEAIRGQQTVLGYVRVHLEDANWKLQTAMVPAENGHFDLMIRKVFK